MVSPSIIISSSNSTTSVHEHETGPSEKSNSAYGIPSHFLFLPFSFLTNSMANLHGPRRNTPFLRLIAQKSQRQWYRQLAYKERCRRRQTYQKLSIILYLIIAFYITSLALFLLSLIQKSLGSIARSILAWIYGTVVQPGETWSNWNLVLAGFEFFMDLAVQHRNPSLYENKQTPIDPVQIFVRGSFKTQMLKIYTNTTVRDVKTELRRRRLISDPTNRRTHLITAPTRLHPLQDNERLYEIGIENMMTIHVRNRLLGGAPASERHTFDGARTRFTPATGVFPSKHPESGSSSVNQTYRD
ncbi:hypothetical protein F5880DRAFT_57113 [Lentinula raphanica]|nr:hypothetical protein F5880DRAFT_57113 [Lentinula raphanica]